MYKILENNQIVDVMENLKFVKCLPRTKRVIHVDERQANGIMSSNDGEIYHLYGTPYTFEGNKKTVRFEEIDAQEYEKLTQQLKDNEKLEERVRELERMLREIYTKFL
jgi:uncharacterized protein with ACT and thioredoxin-like domain